MPILGYGVYQVTKDECERCVLDALEAGYRSIDTAQSYYNEEEVGSAMKKSGIPREEIFLASNVWVEHYGYEETKKSVEESLRKLQTEYLDLMLLHQPLNDYYGTYGGIGGTVRRKQVAGHRRVQFLSGPAGGYCFLYENSAHGQSDRDLCAESAGRRS